MAIESRAEGTPSPDGGDSVILSPPQPLLVASQTFQQEMSSSSRLSQGQWVWAPLSPRPLEPSAGLEGHSHEARGASSSSAGIMMAPHAGWGGSDGTWNLDFSDF